MAMSQYLYDTRQLKKLLKRFTGLKVYDAKVEPLGLGNTYFGVSEEYVDSNNPHITVAQKSWCLDGYGEYKVCVYLPFLLVGNVRRKPNLRYHESVIENIREALESEFGEDWNGCCKGITTWRPMSRHDFYLQIPNFERKEKTAP